MSVNIYIEGDKLGFNSKTAIEKFKIYIKANPNFDLLEVSNKFIKNDYTIEVISKDTYDIKFKLIKNEEKVVDKIEEKVVKKVDEKSERRKLLKLKINSLKQSRTNSEYHKAQLDENVSDDILKEYSKLKKMAKMPIPDPSDILSDPEKYKPVITGIMASGMIKQLGVTHPYAKYFRLISEKLGISNDDIQNFANSQTETQTKDPILTNIQGKSISNDNDTDSEEE